MPAKNKAPIKATSTGTGGLLLPEKIEAPEYDDHFQLVFEAINQRIATQEPPNREIGSHAC